MPGWSAPHEDAVRRNKAKFNSGELVWDGVERGPELPDDRHWCDRTKEWWHGWRTSAQATRFDWSDWEYMLEVALLHNQLWGSDELKPGEYARLKTEIRVSLQTYGYTDGDRQRMRMTIKYPEDDNVAELTAVPDEPADNVVAIDYRKRLGG